MADNLTRWEPEREMLTLREAMDRLFNDAFTRPLSVTREGGSAWSTLPIDMYQTDNDVVVKAALPGLKPEEVQINVTDDILTIRGETQQQDAQSEKDKAWHIREQRWGVFQRSISLPTPVKSEQAQAEFENGILTITLPKSEQAKPKIITIKPKK